MPDIRYLILSLSPSSAGGRRRRRGTFFILPTPGGRPRRALISIVDVDIGNVDVLTSAVIFVYLLYDSNNGSVTSVMLSCCYARTRAVVLCCRLGGILLMLLRTACWARAGAVVVGGCSLAMYLQ